MSRKARTTVCWIAMLAALLASAAAASAGASPSRQAPPSVPAVEEAGQPAAPATGAAPEPAEHAGQPAHEGEHAEEHETSIWSTIARVLNFAVLAGILVYFARSPFVQYLVDRGQAIRADLVRAASAREQATVQMAEIEARIKSLPGELDLLRKRGAEDVLAEERRIREATETERERLLAQTRQEIDRHTRLAERGLVELGADLAVKVAAARIKRTIGSEDQVRLVDRYLAGMRQGRTPV